MVESKFILKGPEKEFVVNEKGLGWAFYEGFLKNKDKIGQICSQTGVRETFGDVLKRVVCTAIEMKKRGITSEDVISVCSYNHLNSSVPVLASLFLNCKVACLDPTISVADTKHLINQTKPNMIFIGEEAEDLIAEVLKDSPFKCEVITFGKSSKYERFINFLKPNPEEEAFQPVPAKNLRDTIVIFFSSGTTGLAKGICLHHYALMCQLSTSENFGTLTNGIMAFASHYWISTMFMLYTSVRTGTPRVLVPKFEGDSVLKYIDVFKPSIVFAAPSQFLEMLKGGIPEGIDTSSVILIFTGGHSVSIEQLQWIRKQFSSAMVFEGYGQTEACGGVTAPDLATEQGRKLLMIKKGSCGTVVPGTSYKVVDTDTEEICGPNQRGELRIKSDFVMNGYYNVDSSSAWDEDGWLKTGDVVYYDEDNYFYHVDRVKEMLKYKSWHVVPAKLESVIAQHPDVMNVVVVGVPHPLDGDHPCGVVTLKDGAKATAEDIKKFANAQLDDRQQLRGGLKIIDTFPWTPTGKFKRREVKQNVINGVY